MRDSEIDRRDTGDGGQSADDNRKETSHEDQEDCRQVSDAEPENSERYPGKRRKTAKEIDRR